ncbi:NADPH-dependent 1-acyldihydroxyacetone phosphate reductase [Daldinia childiae]|uniref:NADPH-dependent 1-acyldihydroxyacetone phosphate reductase n=1 Tax=Daldinia childiae TaxID=326645 RepID=UPI001447F5A3|nr:NADPH-dependent 1-acyldihydroxyacetone phosphate reductase [Daldinia childiae]KAF3063607.1 NADPH-dependent 1-acyldihydroxyacetone phosphate reductase [Daldinia childiae]
MSTPKRSVLITGCSGGGMGSALAIAFHKAGFHVYATARNSSKMTELVSLGIDTLQLDIQSESSIADCVSKVPSLDILINNAGLQFLMPIVDINIAEARKLYDLNVWSHIAMIQAFLPLLLKSPNGVIVNQTSIGASLAIPFQAVYNSSKAALAMLTDSLRLELQPFGIKVVDLRTGIVKTNLIKNLQDNSNPKLPKGSIYEPAKEVVEKALRQEGFEDKGMPAHQWAELVVRDLQKSNPPAVIWSGESACLVRTQTVLPSGLLDGMVKKMVGLDVVEQIVKK